MSTLSTFDPFAIARSLIEEFGDEVEVEIKKKISQQIATGNCDNIKQWYEIEDAVREVREGALKA